MIRKYKPEDIDKILDVWDRSSALAHPFLEDAFVEKVEKDIREIYIPNSEAWVYEEGNIVGGFISMIGNEIAGLFVLPNHHSKGIGTQLVNFVDNLYDDLEVEVFEKNAIGKAFYKKYGFKLIKQFLHKETGNEILRLKFK